MPVFINEKIERITQKEFHCIDEKIMKGVFDIHNDIGRFYDEKIYHNELNYIATQMGFQAKNEIEICVKHKDFFKKYYLDLLIKNSCIYEIKAVDKLTGIHKKQLINYLLLSNISHGKLINFRTSSAEYEFVSTNLTFKDRMNYNLNTNEFINLSNNSKLFFDIISDLLNDWGAFLDVDLYREATIYFLGGKDEVIKPIEILRQDRIVGQQKICKLDEKIAFHFSGLKKYFISYETNIRRILNHTNLKAIQWVNFNKRDIKFKTIK